MFFFVYKQNLLFLPKIIHLMILRNDYCKKIIPYIDKSLIKVLVGQRRVGKSYVLKMIAQYVKNQNENANIIFIDKEDFDFDFIIDAKSLVDFVSPKLVYNQKNYLFIDEIQEIKDFEKALRSFLSKEQCDIFCTGSNAKVLSGELATYLSGRYIEFRIHGLSYKEFLDFHKLNDNDESFGKYIHYGGLPHLFELGLQENLVNEYLKNLYTTILLKDIVSREKFRNVAFLEKLSHYLADNIGSYVSALNISKYLKSQNIDVNPSVIINYIRAMCNAFVVQKTPRFDIQGKKIFDNNDKYFFEDLGLRNVLTGFSFIRDIHKLLENIVYKHLILSGFEVYVGRISDKEIDFVGKKNGKYMYVQVAYLLTDQETVEREFGNLENIKDNYPKYVVSMDNAFSESDYNGVQHLPIRAFLLMNFE